MKKTQPVNIEPLPPPSMRAFLTIFIAVFGVAWLFLEPMTSFNLLPKYSTLSGWLGYAGLLGGSALVAYLLVSVYRRQSKSGSNFVLFSVASASDGIVYLVKSPGSMLVSDFVRGFVEHLMKGSANPKVQALLRTHQPVLQVLGPQETTDVSNAVSLDVAGIVDGTHCQLAARPIESQILFSRSAPDEDE